MAISKLILNGEVQMDVTSNTNVAGNMLSGVIGTKNDGTSVTGNIATKTSSDLTASGATVTAPAGYYANAASKAVSTITHPNPTAAITSSTGVVTASHTQGTGYVTGGTTTGTLSLTTQAGKTVTPTESAQTVVASYRWTTGPISVAAISSTYVGTGVAKKSSADLTASGSTVTAPAGYYSTAATKNISAGSAFPPAVTITKAPTIGVNTSGVVTASYNGSSSITPTVNAGYISQGTAGTISTTGTSTYQLTSKAAATYYPSTADQTIASQRWLVGNQTIKSVTISNLTAENIAEGVVVQVGDSSNASRITQITGTHSGAPTYTATIIRSGSNNSYFKCYVTYNGTVYRLKDETFEFHGGDTVTFSLYNDGAAAVVVVDDTTIYSVATTTTSTTYNYTLPNHDIDIQLNNGSQVDPYGFGVYVVSPTINIIENGKYEVGGYGYANVDVQAKPKYTATINGTGNSSYCYVTYNGTKKYTDGDTFTFEAGDTLILYSRGSNIQINEDILVVNNYQYSYIIPENTGNITINMSYTSLLTNHIYVITEYCSTEKYMPATIIAQNTSMMTHTIIGFSSYINDLPYIATGMFEGRQFQSGTYTFTNAQRVGSYGFAWGITGGYTGISEPIIFNFLNCSRISTGGFLSRHFLTEVNFPICTYIENSAFYNCGSLTTVSFPMCTSIGSSAFESCTSLAAVDFPVCTTIQYGVFSNCSHLATANFPSCTSIGGYAFNYCSTLTNISFPVCTTIGAQAFINCYSLTTISFPSCTTIGSSAFYNCTHLVSINFARCVSIYDSAFHNCQVLTTISFPTCSLVSYAAFEQCSTLSTVNFPACTIIGYYAFSGCSSLATISFPSCTSIGAYAFSGCRSLTTASFPSCTSIGAYAFRDCYHLLSLYLLGSSVPILSGTSVFYSTPISNYTTSTGGVYGKIYVPASLYNSYITATNWSVYSSRIVSVQGG